MIGYKAVLRTGEAIFLRIVVFSDSHGDYETLDAITENQIKADAFIHLGDGLRELYHLRDAYPEKRFLCVRGNADFGYDEKYEDTLDIGGVRIYFTHGHIQGAKRGVRELVECGKEHGADIICYGHTHCSAASVNGGVYLLNPGSVSRPRCGQGKSYAVIDLTEAGVAINIVGL